VIGHSRQSASNLARALAIPARATDHVAAGPACGLSALKLCPFVPGARARAPNNR
jgi:hypothetical protein